MDPQQTGSNNASHTTQPRSTSAKTTSNLCLIIVQILLLTAATTTLVPQEALSTQSPTFYSSSQPTTSTASSLYSTTNDLNKLDTRHYVKLTGTNFMATNGKPLNMQASSSSSSSRSSSPVVFSSGNRYFQSQSRILSSASASGSSRQTIYPNNKSDSMNMCMGTSNRLSVPSNKTDHYRNLVERYKNCTYVSGNLEVTWLNEPNEVYDMSFLESIREVSGYLLIANVQTDRVKMPNLQLIRGRDFYKTSEGYEFALFLIDTSLQTLEMPNLREILSGDLGFYNNPRMAYINTINWEEILNPPYKSIFVYDGAPPDKPNCHPLCASHCWAEGAHMCQKFTKRDCHSHCQPNRCYGPGSKECCHSYCVGGCFGPNQTDCFACRNFYDDGTCKQDCPSMQRYNHMKFLWEPNPDGKYAYGGACVKKCPEYLLRDNGACVRSCPPNKRSINGECVLCSGACQKNCQGVEVVHSGNIDQLVNCTVIEGSITITDASFTGNLGGESGGMNNNSTSSPRYKQMHPDKLEVFKTLREITGYLSIQASHPQFRNLSYFGNLKTISGRQTTDNMSPALSITKTSLVSLNLRSLRLVKGKISITNNEELCFADTIDWDQLKTIPADPLFSVNIGNNAPNSKCSQFRCHDQCAKDGCWGPGPDECLSCKSYKLDDYCVHNCSSIEPLDILAYLSSPNNCKKCHPECKLGCSGPEAKDCKQCKNVKDGPYCVSECPSHKYNKNGLCEECDKSCLGGCSGPSNVLGEGGCLSCEKAIINSTEPNLVAHCIRADDQCPEAYYQEYVGRHTEAALLKLSQGKPVCRKCHHRCKSCTAMGSHVSVCECAKYIANEQCEDYCPRDYFAHESLGQCIKCHPECNGCTGPSEAECSTCRVYRIYYESSLEMSLLQSSNGQFAVGGIYDAPGKQRFNCTAQCPMDKPHRIGGSNLLDPYCSEYPDVDLENPRLGSLGSTSVMLFIVILMTAMIVCFYIYRCQIEKDKTVKLTMHLSGIDDVEPLHPSNLKPNLAPLRSIKETELRKGNILGSGFGGTVYQGFWYPEGQEHKQPRPVAIKVLRDNEQSNVNKEFLDEAYIMASVNHPNLVRLLAVCMTPNHLMLVTQLMPLGCLLEYVKKHKNDIGAKNLLEWCKQIARGMSYLEDHRMVHRDLALRNVLLQTSGRALISDFGLAKFLEIDQSEYQSGGGRLPIKWLAPECIRERKFTHKSDVWAFGVTVWELLTFGMKPFEEYETRDVPAAIEKGARLHQPGYMSAEVYKVMYACWFYSPEDRPSFRSLAQSFLGFARDPERYLICGTKGIEYTSKQLKPDKLCDTSHLQPSSESDADNGCDYGSTSDGSDSMGLGDDEDDEPHQTNLAALPDLTPTTHNRLNEMFGFELRQHPELAHSNISVGLNKSHSLKKLFPVEQRLGRESSALIMEDAFSSATLGHKGASVDHSLKSTGQQANILMPDSNNNTVAGSNFMANSSQSNNATTGGCWRHSSLSSHSLGPKFTHEQPTDVYDYLLPSPCTADAHSAGHSHFSTLYSDSYHQTGKSTGGLAGNAMAGSGQLRNPPLSAGLVGVNNEEYFMTRVAYVNHNSQQQLKEEEDEEELAIDASKGSDQHRQLEHSCRQLSTSNGNIPYSLV